MIHKLKTWLTSLNNERSPEAPDDRSAVCAILLEAVESSETSAAGARQEALDLLRTLLARHFDISAAEADELIALTQEARQKAIDLWPFTTVLAQRMGETQKFHLLIMVWRVILADGLLDAQEDALARRLCSMLAVNHSVAMRAKKQARQDLDHAAPKSNSPEQEPTP